MRKNFWRIIMIVSFTIFIWGCKKNGGGPTGPPGPPYSELVQQGWTAFQSTQYDTAIVLFSLAKQMNSNKVDAYVGLGWSYMKLDQLTTASDEFNMGSQKANPPADLFGGWAFVLNALRDYGGSNAEADQVFTLDPTWTFSYGLPLSKDDLHVLKAENYFLLGNYTYSLNEVKRLNSGFNADVTTSIGRAALAAEIERLKGIS
jgi:tetratricopeptide (TPR) repeat protein